MQILPYEHEAHFESCMEVFDSNCPRYFLEEEREEFAEWLTNRKEPYWVVLNSDNQLVGSGGIYLAEEHTNSSAEFPNEVGFAWGMVNSTYHKKGYGKALLEFRLKFLRENHSSRPIVLRTSQHTYQFFEKLGFKTRSYHKNGWGSGLDKVIMVYSN